MPDLAAHAIWLGAVIGTFALSAGARIRTKRCDVNRCASCGYDLAGLPAASLCPECAGRERQTVVERVTPEFRRGDAIGCAAVLTGAALWGALAPAIIWSLFYLRAGFTADLALRLSLTHRQVTNAAAEDAAVALLLAAAVWALSRRVAPGCARATVGLGGVCALGATLFVLIPDLWQSWRAGAVFRPGGFAYAWAVGAGAALFVLLLFADIARPLPQPQRRKESGGTCPPHAVRSEAK